MAHVKNNSGQQEWYTPPAIIEAARRTMGGIDLDPASNVQAQEWIQAGSYYTRDDDGLLLSWGGKVWLNPPYEGKLIRAFVDKLLSERGVEQAITLTNNATETAWGQRLLSLAGAVCFPAKRIRYLSPTGEKNTGLQGQMICGFNVDRVRFKQEFEEFGYVLINPRGEWKGEYNV